MNKLEQKQQFSIKVNHRPWWVWALWGLWLLGEIMFFQGALASAREFESRAAILFWLLFGLFLMGGITVWLVQKSR
jgi:hypothetical protein